MPTRRKLRKSVISEQVENLRQLARGDASPEQIDKRATSVEELLETECDTEDHLAAVIQRCIRELEFFPTSAKVMEIVDQIRSERMPFWKAPEVAKRTRQDIFDDMEFQRVFAIERPKHAHLASERIAELEAELSAMEGKLE